MSYKIPQVNNLLVTAWQNIHIYTASLLLGSNVQKAPLEYFEGLQNVDEVGALFSCYDLVVCGLNLAVVKGTLQNWSETKIEKITDKTYTV